MNLKAPAVCLLLLVTLAVGIAGQGTLKDAERIQGWIQALRRELHEIPELGFEEEKTNAFVRNELERLKIKYDYPVAKTGIIGRIGHGKPLIALRTDMDALPIQEEVESDFKSKQDGLMHACGHDGHMAMLLGAARLLKEREGNLKGTVLLIFQPAEEGLAGGKSVLDSGKLKGVSAIHGIHLWPTLDSGFLASKAGPIMAGSTSFWIKVHGKGGHAAMPHLTIDPIVAGSAIVQTLQSLVSRETNPTNSVVISITRFNTGAGATNVIPDDVSIGGTLRALEEKEFAHLVERIEEVAKGVGEAHGCKVSFKWRNPHYLPTVNDPPTFHTVERLVKNLLGDSKWVNLDAPSMGGEDFSFLAKEIPASFTWLGIRNESCGAIHGLHTARFQLDESVLHIGSALHTDFALHYLSNRGLGSSQSEL